MITKLINFKFYCRCPTCGASVYEAEKVVTSVGSFHSSCMRCTKCTRQVTFLDILCQFMSFCVILCHFVSFCVILCHFVSFCVILCHFVTICVILQQMQNIKIMWKEISREIKIVKNGHYVSTVADLIKLFFFIFRFSMFSLSVSYIRKENNW